MRSSQISYILCVIVGESGPKWKKAPDEAGVLALKGEVERMFLGQFYHTLDDKGRLTIPARYREILAVDGAFIMQGFDQNLFILPSAVYEAISRGVSEMSLTDPRARLLKRLVFSTADHVEFDRAGRILIPQFLRQAAKLENDVVVVGNGDYFEIWSSELWSGQAEQMQDAQANADRFTELKITSR